MQTYKELNACPEKVEIITGKWKFLLGCLCKFGASTGSAKFRDRKGEQSFWYRSPINLISGIYGAVLRLLKFSHK